MARSLSDDSVSQELEPVGGIGDQALFQRELHMKSLAQELRQICLLLFGILSAASDADNKVIGVAHQIEGRPGFPAIVPPPGLCPGFGLVRRGNPSTISLVDRL